MATVFDYISDVLFTKKKTHIDDIEVDNTYNLYMLNRWVSMYSPDTANLINLTTNRLYTVFTTKRESYTFLFNILPKCKFTRLPYIKKVTDKKSEDDVTVKFLAKKLELSEREINYYISDNKIDIKKYKKLWDR